MNKGDYKDQERPPRIMTKRELRGKIEKMKCCECDAVGIYWNEKRNLYYCQEHNPRRPVSEEFALKPIPRDKRNVYTFSNKAKNKQTADRMRELILRRKSMVAKQYE